MGMKWPGIIVATVVTLGLIVGVGFLISYFHPANQDIVQVMDDNDSVEDHPVASNPQSQSRCLLPSYIVLLVLAYFYAF